MTQLSTTMDHAIQTDEAPGYKRLAVMLYGILAYGVGVVGLAWIMLGMAGIAPVGFSPVNTGSNAFALLINLALIFVFGLQHSIMARAGFKDRIKSIMPEAMERSTYVLLSGVCIVLAIYFWQPTQGTVWVVENSVLQVALWTLFIGGWGYLFLATFVTNHFELMGLRQVYLYFRNQPYSRLPFTRKYMYRYSRHPMMLGLLLGMWCVPVMSVTQFVMAGLFTIYMAIGVALEERELIRQFGDTYREYRRQIAALVPKVF